MPLTEPADAPPSSTPSPASVVPVPGELIGGTYRVTGTIGSGAMGVVLSATDEALGRDVAIKLIRSELSHPSFRQRFREEAHAMALVNHPNVVIIHSFGEHAGAPYFAMERVNGRTLDRLLAERTSMELDFAVALLDQACRGLSAIHAAGAVHRDIKPGNLIVDHQSRLRISDLGLAAFYRDRRVPREIVGTPGYIAPEVLAGATATPKSDVYSLACVAYELLTGKPPFERLPTSTSSAENRLEPPIPPSSVRAGLPAAFDEVLCEALVAEPSERTPSVEFFRRALNQALHDSFEPTRLLLVDDDDDHRETLEQALALEFADADIESVSNGTAALAAFERKPPDVVVSDLQMPDLDGKSLTERLRAREDAQSVPIIVLTASGGPREWRELAALGADRFVLKPVVLGDLSAAIRRALRERRGG